jgi:hypothetical protein
MKVVNLGPCDAHSDPVRSVLIINHDRPKVQTLDELNDIRGRERYLKESVECTRVIVGT